MRTTASPTRPLTFSRDRLRAQARAAGQQGRHWLAASIYNVLGTLDGSDVDAWLRASEHHEREGRYDEAARAAWFAAGRLSLADRARAVQMGRRALALDPFMVERSSCREQVHRLGPAFASVVWEAAEDALGRRRLAEARVLLRLAAEIEPDALGTRERWAGLDEELSRCQLELQERLRSPGGAGRSRLEAANQLLALAPGDVDARCLAARVFIDERHFEVARGEVRAILRDHPDHLDALRLMAELEAKDLDSAAALRALRRALWLMRSDETEVERWVSLAASWLPDDRSSQRDLEALRQDVLGLAGRRAAMAPPPPPVVVARSCS